VSEEQFIVWVKGLPKRMSTARAELERHNLSKMYPQIHFMRRYKCYGEIFARLAR